MGGSCPTAFRPDAVAPFSGAALTLAAAERQKKGASCRSADRRRSGLSRRLTRAPQTRNVQRLLRKGTFRMIWCDVTPVFSSI
jgi:hypothetical protein